MGGFAALEDGSPPSKTEAARGCAPHEAHATQDTAHAKPSAAPYMPLSVHAIVVFTPSHHGPPLQCRHPASVCRGSLQYYQRFGAARIIGTGINTPCSSPHEIKPDRH